MSPENQHPKLSENLHPSSTRILVHSTEHLVNQEELDKQIQICQSLNYTLCKPYTKSVQNNKFTNLLSSYLPTHPSFWLLETKTSKCNIHQKNVSCLALCVKTPNQIRGWSWKQKGY